ncbi:hypothetical protein MTLP_05640 [Candidatus Methanoliparum sp. LAM-1]|nr:hypothetical protein MTLP_05640 [Candidatus Methanoliparum sp. LAM-1]
MKLSEIGCVMTGVGGILVATGVIIDWITHGFLNIPLLALACVTIFLTAYFFERRRRREGEK